MFLFGRTRISRMKHVRCKGRFQACIFPVGIKRQESIISAARSAEGVRLILKSLAARCARENPRYVARSLSSPAGALLPRQRRENAGSDDTRKRGHSSLSLHLRSPESQAPGDGVQHSAGAVLYNAEADRQPQGQCYSTRFLRTAAIICAKRSHAMFFVCLFSRRICNPLALWAARDLKG